MHIVEVIFLGTGTSGTVPNIGCLTDANSTCKTCNSTRGYWARSGSPQQFYKNKRGNTSVLVKLATDAGDQKTIVIDAGKSFYSSALEWFPRYGIRKIDVVLITHGHADAILGLDDLRQWTLRENIQKTIDIYASDEAISVIGATFPYLVNRDFATGGGDVTNVTFHSIGSVDNPVPFPLFDNSVHVQPITVEHGLWNDCRPFHFTGFRIEDFAYISDVSFIPPRSRNLLSGVSCIVLDGLKPIRHISHFSITDAVKECILYQQPTSDCIKGVAPTLALITGFGHSVEHDELEQECIKLEETLAQGGTTAINAGPSDPQREAYISKYFDMSAEEIDSALRTLKIVPKIRPAFDGMRLRVTNGDSQVFTLMDDEQGQ